MIVKKGIAGTARKPKSTLAGLRTRQLPQMDMATSLAITSALKKVDLSARDNPFYDPREVAHREKEDVIKSLADCIRFCQEQGGPPRCEFIKYNVNTKLCIWSGQCNDVLDATYFSNHEAKQRRG